MPSTAAGPVGLVFARRFPISGRAAQADALATFFALMPGCSLVSAGMVAEALFQVSAVPPVLLAKDRSQLLPILGTKSTGKRA